MTPSASHRARILAVVALLATQLAELVADALVLHEAWYWLLLARGPGLALVQWCGVVFVARVVLWSAGRVELDLAEPPLRRVARAVLRSSLLWLLLAAVVFLGVALRWQFPV